MHDPQSKTIGRYEYTVTPLGGRAASKLLARVFGRISPVLSTIDIKRGMAVEMEVLKAVAGVLGNLTDADIDYLFDAFCPCTRASIHPGQPPSVFTKAIADATFAGEQLEMVGWLRFCFEVNFGDFLAVLGEKLASATAPVSSGPAEKPAL
jgi:hypothetical protein